MTTTGTLMSSATMPLMGRRQANHQARGNRGGGRIPALSSNAVTIDESRTPSQPDVDLTRPSGSSRHDAKQKSDVLQDAGQIAENE